MAITEDRDAVVQPRAHLEARLERCLDLRRDAEPEDVRGLDDEIARLEKVLELFWRR
jgi:hypothetical protein